MVVDDKNIIVVWPELFTNILGCPVKFCLPKAQQIRPEVFVDTYLIRFLLGL